MRLICNPIALESEPHERTVAAANADAALRVAAIARLLPAEDRRLIDLLHVEGLSQRAAAIQLGIAPGVISRRARRLRNLLASPMVRAIAANLDSLAPHLREIAVEHFFSRVSIPLLCERTGVTRRTMEQRLDYVIGWVRGIQRAALSRHAPIDGDDADEECESASANLE